MAESAAPPKPEDQDSKKPDAGGDAPAGSEKPAAAPAAAPPPKKPDSGSVVTFNERYKIDSSAVLPDFSFDTIKAFRVIPANRQDGNFFALICDRALTPRIRAAVKYEKIINPQIAQMVARGVVYWPHTKQEQYAFIYKDTLGKRLLPPDKKPAMGLKQEYVMEAVVRPLTNILLDFRDKDFVHGAIRAGNLYCGSATGLPEKVFLGECLATPPDYGQPIIYMPIERSLVEPVGRGAGTQAEDLYALGVTLAVLLRSNDPLEGLSDHKIVRAKMEHGSYAAVTGKDRFKGSILELLRGLLHDDVTQRWTIDEVTAWLDGRRLSPKQAVRPKKAARPLSFMGNRYLYAPMLAMDLSSNPQETMKIVDNEELEQWLSRSVEDDDAVERVTQAIQKSREFGRGPGYEDRLVSNLSFALDPLAPMRYKGLSLLGDGVGTALTKAMVEKKEVNTYAELFSQSIALNWVTTQSNPNLDVGVLISRFDNCRNFVRQSKIGYGLERCLYLLSPETHCLSEKLKNYFVRDAEDMINAFEDMCQKGKAPVTFLDRHSAAFLCVKDPKSVEPYLYDLGNEETHKQILANLKCLATIQKRHNLNSFPGIAQAFVDILNAVYKRYHDREIRDKLKKNINRFAAEGDLVKMAGLLDNSEVIDKDFVAFKRAMQEYADLKAEHSKLETNLENKSAFGKSTGKDVAAVVSSIIASVVIIFVTFMFFSK